MTWSDVQPYAIGGAIAAVAWVLKTMIFDAINKLESKIDKQGKRFGMDIADIKEWRAACEGPAALRARSRTGAVPNHVDDDGGE